MQKILIYNSGGGLGDSIALFPLILSLKNHFKESHFYLLSAHENHFSGKLKEYGITMNSLNLNLKYFGFRWHHFFKTKSQFIKLNIKKFDLIIDLQSKFRNTIILKKIPHKNFYSSTFNYKFCTIKGNYKFSENIVKKTISNLNIFLKTDIETVKYNTNNLPKYFLDEAKRLLPNNNYIGFSITQGNVYRKKTWPIQNIIEVANKIKKKGDIPVFFIEKNDIELINKIKTKVESSIFPELNTKSSCPALVTALSLRLKKAISIDNGVMHMIALSEIPMVVLFGPTNSDKFAPKNYQTSVIDSNVLYKSDDISKITTEDVLKKI
tara:strand:- start:762 stop:1730 length:969 start_codon:yes stop_codon:yes gene_type:complete